ncbi:AMP-binding protein [Sphaerisporangium sp. NPDC051017]|uniref:AMP-binding protein n=1 Tax=Sphaerisporangium sp. NPDC051017 TaxID=3154636 RepID=UPI00342D2524
MVEQVLMPQPESGPTKQDRQTDTALHALARAVAVVPDQVFLDFSGDLYTYAETERLATRFAHELIRLGLEPGQTVATLLDNSMDQVVSWLAINKAGGLWVPLNTAYRGDFLRHPIDDSLATIVVADTRYIGDVAAISADLPHLRLVLRRGPATGEAPACAVPIEALDDHRGTDDTPIPISAQPGDLSMLIYTSGTTGVSKGCMISYNFILNQGRQSNQAVPPLPGDVMYTPLPLFHVAAIDVALSGLLAQARVAISERFSVSGFWAEIERSGATQARLMASIFPLVANAPDTPEMHRCRGQLRSVVGAPFPPALRKVWQDRFGVEFTDGHNYGLSEGVRLAMSRFGDDSMPEDCCGRIADDYEVVILDEDDRILPDGEMGEIAFRPRKPHIMFVGYWRRPEATAEVWRNLWMHTGDYGRIANGYLFFVDRKKDYLRSRGENISSFEVETAFLNHPALSEVAAHAADDGINEDCLKITAVLREGHALSEEELCRWALDHVPHFAVPRYIEFRDELPRTPTNKVLKFQLRKQGVTAGTWDREAAGITVRRR